MNHSTSTAQVSIIVQELNNACTIIKNSELQKEAARLRAISAAKDLVAKLENPAETIFRDAFSVRILDYNHNLLGLKRTDSIKVLLLTNDCEGSGPRMRKTRDSTRHLPHFDKEKWPPNQCLRSCRPLWYGGHVHR